MLRPALILVASLTLAACSDRKVETETPDNKVSISIDSDAKATAADGESSKLELNLPGGIEAKINLPDGIGESGKFDIDGIGLYPGAVVRSVKVNASEAAATKRAEVQIGFTAPADAAVVADWYQQAFEAKNRAVTRSGETLSGKDADGDDFTIVLTGAGAGKAKGLVTIVDAAKG